jgi:hypothetical protein
MELQEHQIRARLAPDIAQGPGKYRIVQKDEKDIGF